MSLTEEALDGFTGWPAEVAASYREAGYWQGRDLSSLLRDWAASYGDRVALIAGERRITFAELDDWADRLAAGFGRHGVQPGDRIVLQLPNVPEFVASFFALLRAGALPVFALAAHRASEIRHLCEVSGAVGYLIADRLGSFDFVALARQLVGELPALRHVFVLGEPDEFVGFGSLDVLDAEPVEIHDLNSAEPAFFLLSGGTTALPKLIPRTHDDYAYQLAAASEVCELRTSDVYLAVLPIEFNFPWGCPGVLGTLRAGGTVVIAGDASAAECFTLIERHGVTFTSVVPTVGKLWLEEADWNSRDLGTLRFVQIGGAKCPPELAEALGPALGCRVQQVFGMAEGMLTYTRSADGPEVVTRTQGRVLSPADELRVVDDEDNDVGPDVPGHLLSRGPYTLRGYYRAPEHNARAFTADGFYRTGDIVRVDAAGNMTVEGRAKDVIIRGGDKISAAEIEGYLLEHPAVDQVAVVAIADEALGERTCACVIPAADAPTLPALRKLMWEQGVAEYKLPDRLEIFQSFPLTPLGKVDKKAMTVEVTDRSRAKSRGVSDVVTA